MHVSVKQPAAEKSAGASHGRGGASQAPKRVALRFALAACGLCVFFGLVSWFIAARVERTVRMQLGMVMRGTLSAAVDNLQLWFESAERATVSAAQDPRVVSGISQCAVSPESCGELSATLQTYARTSGFAHFRITDRAGIVRASAPGSSGAVRIPAEVLARAESLRRGQAAAFVPLLASGEPSVFVAAGVYAQGPARVGILLFELGMDGFDRVLRAARVGKSGETYAFDRQGRMLSDSRFDDQLARIGLLPSTDAVRVFTLRDPGGDLTQGFVPTLPRVEQPLTRVVARALAFGAGTDVDGYRDYRGVPVVGAWRFLPNVGLGVTTEIDVAEAYRTLTALQHLLLSLMLALTLAALGLLSAMSVAERLRGRAQAAERLMERFGQYRIERKLGEGGMGTVYLASHALLRRYGAIKLLRADRSSPDALSRFEREVQITSTLTHPNTVAVYDYGRTEDGTFFYVMEYLEGLDLQRLVARFGPLPQARVVHFLRQLCGSLTEAHGAGLVHRDIKPANLVACTRGGLADTLKVLDFGLVHENSLERGHASQPPAQVFGTPEYMAPELFESAEQASPQSDLYSIGVLAYFLLTGAPPFSGGTTEELCLSHLTRKPDPLTSADSAALDPELQAVVDACLAKRPALRPSNAAALRALLDRSALAGAWTQGDAESWWVSRALELRELRAQSETPASETSTRFVPVRP